MALCALITLLVLLLPSNATDTDGVGVDAAVAGDAALDPTAGSATGVTTPDGAPVSAGSIDPATGKPVPRATSDAPQGSAPPPPTGADCRADGRQHGIYVD